MNEDRHLGWEGCYNVRDLGGFRTLDGGSTRRGVLVRADVLDGLTPSGWAALESHGVRTIVDLRNPDEIQRDVARPRSVNRVHVPMDDVDDAEFWRYCWDNELDGTPLFYEPFLEHKAERCAAVIEAIARAEPGVVFHCGQGRDRTGLISLLLLSLARVGPEDIADDYELSTKRLSVRASELGEEDWGPQADRILASRNVTARSLILDILDRIDPFDFLLGAGLEPGALERLQTRFVSYDGTGERSSAGKKKGNAVR